MAPVERRFTSRSEAETEALGEALGRVVQPGDFVGLIGDLGAGKTRFVRGLSRGAEVPPEEVASPTFAIVYPYKGRVLIHHADLYRLSSADELYAAGYFDLLNGESAVIVEWADKVAAAVPADALVLHFVARSEDDDSLRELTARATGENSAKLLSRWAVSVDAHDH